MRYFSFFLIVLSWPALILANSELGQEVSRQQWTGTLKKPGFISCGDRQGDYYDESAAELPWDSFLILPLLNHSGRRLRHLERSPNIGQSDLCTRVEGWNRALQRGEALSTKIISQLFELKVQLSSDHCERWLTEVFSVQIDGITFESNEMITMNQTC